LGDVKPHLDVDLPAGRQRRQKDSAAIRKHLGISLEIGHFALEFKRQTLDGLIGGHVQFHIAMIRGRAHCPVKAITGPPKAREALHVCGDDAGWQAAQEILFRPEFPLGFRSVNQVDVGGAVFRVRADDFESLVNTLYERRVLRIIDGDGEFVNPAVFLEKKS
jgi:hypothetical protein